jgi:Spy/CpxP family protein refolding chaperone
MKPKTGMKRLAIGLMLALAAPLSAQMPADAPPGGRDGSPGMHRGGHHGYGSMTPEGREIMKAAMRDTTDPEARQQLRAARDRIGTLVAADRLDVGALKSAMDAERRLVDQQHVRRQAAMLAAFQKLSVADRRAFVADAQAGRDRMEKRMKNRIDRAKPAPAQG